VEKSQVQRSGIGNQIEFIGGSVMDTKVIVVGSAKAGTLERRRPRIRFTGEWLKPIGFTPDSLVRFSRDQGVVTFTLMAFTPTYT
jgi:hypothetical protein